MYGGSASPLAEAWDSGASVWSAQRREAYANDLDAAASLVAVTARSNRSKSDQDPAQWLPPAAKVHCRYVAEWVGTKLRWPHAVCLTSAERHHGLRGLVQVGAWAPQRRSSPVDDRLPSTPKEAHRADAVVMVCADTGGTDGLGGWRSGERREWGRAVSDDAVLGRLLRQIHDMAPADLPEVLRGHYAALCVTRLTVYLADLQENVLVAMPDAQANPVNDLPIEGTQAGWTYRSVSPRISADEDGLVLWLPLLDGVERVGVLKVQAPSFDKPKMLLCESLASLVTLIVLDKADYSDDYATAMRAQPMSLPAEMVWAFLPSRTIGTGQVTSSAVLEPAYELGGDAFEHGIIGNFLHAAVFDAMGHDLQAGLTSSVALAASRNTRRRGAGLTDTAHAIDQAVSDAFPDRYATAVLTHLDLVTGHLSWINCGHPAPLLIRGAEVVHGAMERAGELPLGLAAVHPDMPRTLHHLQLEPGDRVLLYTDGVTDARSHAGERFGEGGFADFIIRAMAAGEPAPEALRRLMHTLLTHKQQGQLTDDATIVLFEWHPAAPPGTRPSGV